MSDISKEQDNRRYIEILEELIPEIEIGMNLLSYDRSALQAGLEALRHMEGGNNPQPLTCDGCAHYGNWEDELEEGYNSPCITCKRRASDNYRPTYDHEPGESAALINSLTEDCKRRKCEYWSGTDCTLVAPDTGCPFMDDQKVSQSACEYCGNDKPLILMDDTVAYIHWTPEIEKYQLVLGSVSRGGWTVGQEINECPMCGRKLDHEPKGK
jgi:hypothetical protein